MSTPAISIPRIGQPWPGQGGIYAGAIRGAEGQPDRHIVVAAADLGEFAWGDHGKDAPGATSDLDGAANTRTLVAEGDHPAAHACVEFSADGHSDFYLPARRELALAAANVPEVFAKEGWYWSSTQASRHYAFAQYFEHGRSYWLDEGNEFRVRPFRGFILESLDHLNPSTAEGGPGAFFGELQAIEPLPLRDRFAGLAMHAHLITDTVPGEACNALLEAAQLAGRHPLDHLALNAYEAADAMLRARAAGATAEAAS